MNPEQEDFFKNAKIYYLYDDDKKLITSTVIYDGKAPKNGTSVEPFKLLNGVKVLMEDPTFDISKQSWIESEVTPQPSTTQQMIAKLATMIKPQGGQTNE